MRAFLMVLLTLFIAGMSFRTLLWHIQCWQIRWYRWDRMKSYLRTDQGKEQLFSLWWFKGILPRPTITGRSILVFGISSVFLAFVFVGVLFWFGQECFRGSQAGIGCFKGLFFDRGTFLFGFLLVDRLAFFAVAMSVFLSSIPRLLVTKKLFASAQTIREKAEDICVIGITGSYGKTSTKLMIKAILDAHYGAHNVLVSPKNINSEIGLARFIVEQESFFSQSGTKVFLAEIGACSRGEITTACSFIQPDIAVITAVSDQHLELFGSQRNIMLGKWELATAAKAAVFYNWRSEKLAVIADEKRDETSAKLWPVVWEGDATSGPDGISFLYLGETYTLPWVGTFWEANARMAVVLGEYLDIPVSVMQKALASLPQPTKALHKDISGTHSYTLLRDPYSANSQGVLAAIDVLGQASGTKIFVGTPLLELGENEEKVHRQIFEALAVMDAFVFWAKDDWADLGRQLCGDRFCGADWALLSHKKEHLGGGDCVLYEGRITGVL